MVPSLALHYALNNFAFSYMIFVCMADYSIFLFSFFSSVILWNYFHFGVSLSGFFSLISIFNSTQKIWVAHLSNKKKCRLRCGYLIKRLWAQSRTLGIKYHLVGLKDIIESQKSYNPFLNKSVTPNFTSTNIWVKFKINIAMSLNFHSEANHTVYIK